MPDQDLLEKLRKIKALADEAQDDHECQTAMLMFQRLLTKNGLCAAQVQVEAQPEETPDTVDLVQVRRVDTWLKYLYCVLAKHFRCVAVEHHTVNAQWEKVRTLQFIGLPRDVTIAAQAFQTALAAAGRLYERHELRALEDEALAYDTGLPAPDKPNRGRYMMGFAMGLHAAYRRQEAESTFAITLTTPADVLAAVAGFRDGKAADPRKVKRDGNTGVGYADGFNVGRGDRLAGVGQA